MAVLNRSCPNRESMNPSSSSDNFPCFQFFQKTKKKCKMRVFPRTMDGTFVNPTWIEVGPVAQILSVYLSANTTISLIGEYYCEQRLRLFPETDCTFQHDVWCTNFNLRDETLSIFASERIRHTSCGFEFLKQGLSFRAPPIDFWCNVSLGASFLHALL